MALTGTNGGTGTVDSATLNTLPDWYSQYGQALTGAGLGVLQGAMNYQGAVDQNGNPIPRVAGMSPDMQQAAQQVRDNQGSYAPLMQAGIDTTAAGVDAASGAGYNYNNANQVVAGGLSTLGAAKDTIAGAARPISGMESSLEQAQSYLNPAASQLAYGGSTFNPEQFQSYMNPYTGQVNDEIARLGNQNLMENVIPGINSTFTGAGQFGSSRNGDFMNRALRDNQYAISGAQGKVLSDATGQAQAQYAAEKQRELQSGQALGGLSQVAQGVASGYGNEASTTANVGQALAGVGGQEFQGAGQLAGIGSNMLQAGSTLGQLGQLQVGQGTQVQQAGINDVNALLTTGQLDQQVQQKGLDAAYQDYIDQRDHPLTVLGGLSQVLPNVSGKITPNTQTSSVNQDLPTDPATNLQQLIALINQQ